MEEKDFIKLSRIHEEPKKEKTKEVISSLKKLTAYSEKIYIENQSDLHSIVSKIPDEFLKSQLYYLEKIEHKQKEINIGVGIKCSCEEYEKALKTEIHNRKKNNIQITSFDPLLEFDEYEIKTSLDHSQISEIKRK